MTNGCDATGQSLFVENWAWGQTPHMHAPSTPVPLRYGGWNEMWVAETPQMKPAFRTEDSISQERQPKNVVLRCWSQTLRKRPVGTKAQRGLKAPVPQTYRCV